MFRDKPRMLCASLSYTVWKSLFKKKNKGTSWWFSGVWVLPLLQRVWSSASTSGVWVQSLGENLRFHMPHTVRGGRAGGTEGRGGMEGGRKEKRI